MTNEDILQRMEDEIALRSLSPWTKKEYMQKALVLMQYFSPKPLAQVTDPELRTFLLYLKTELKRSAGTLNVYRHRRRLVVCLKISQSNHRACN
jgi:hypothetical protein